VAVPEVTAMVSGFGVQVTPGGNPVEEQVTITFPVKPPLGVTVMVEAALLPAVTVTGAPETVNEPVVPVLTLMVSVPDGPEAW
jgi:hypothetical protein